ncbi:MAG: ABC transporter ATP-binding protein [Lachnospiraceae bacterium]
MALLEAKNISQIYETDKIIEDISIQLNPGEIICLIGSSGVGKTTLFHILSGLNLPTEGKVTLEGEDITGKAGRISYMLQKDMLIPYLSIEDNISLPLRINGQKKKSAREQVQKYFPQFGLSGTQKKYPSQLSGGMRQRAAFLRTYMFSQKVALLDEPFSALDAITKREMHKWYLEVMEEIRLSTIFISHDIDEAILLSDRIYIMSGKPGRIRKELIIERTGPKEEAFAMTGEFLNYKKEILSYLQ